MLVLTRLRQQSVMIGSEIEVTVVEIKGDRVRLGFVAPNYMKILRKEIYDRHDREPETSGSGDGGDAPPA